MRDSPAKTEASMLTATTAVAVDAQNAELAQGIEWIAAPRAGADRGTAICCSHPATLLTRS